ncbi:hypothetical protein PG997_007492 [Apiospora hydei]|uniref:Uncharacterized protein n=1 Tax=Apiospora hydei TaxID=1337664 RepID=A0ABR1W871_9PEZI
MVFKVFVILYVTTKLQGSTSPRESARTEVHSGMALEGKIYACLLSDEVRAAADTFAGHEDDGIVVHLANRVIFFISRLIPAVTYHQIGLTIDHKYYLKSVIQRGVDSLKLVPAGVDEKGAIVRINNFKRKLGDTPLRGMSRREVTLCKKQLANKLELPEVEGDAFDEEVATMIQREAKEVALPMFCPKLAAQLLRFQHNNPLDVLPAGILKVGLLNYWWQRSQKEEGETIPSLPKYLGYFLSCLARAVALGTVFSQNPEEFATSTYDADLKYLEVYKCQLPYEFKDHSIDSAWCPRELDNNPRRRVGYLLTRDLDGADKFELDPTCMVLE